MISDALTDRRSIAGKHPLRSTEYPEGENGLTIESPPPNPDGMHDSVPDDVDLLSSSQAGWLLFSVLIVAMCGIAYELIIAAVSSYLLGNSVAQFSITIGLFMFSMGIGSYLTKFIQKDLVIRFVQIEIAVALVGGFSATILFCIFPTFALYRPTMFLLIGIVGALVGLEIPLLTRILSNGKGFSESLAHVLSLDYLGALIGSVSFPLVLLPSLGLFRSSFAIGLLNIAVAAIALWVLRRTHPALRPYRWGTLAVTMGLLAGLFASTWLARFAEGQLFADEMLYSEQSPYQRIVFTKHPRNGELRLYLDGHLQFAASDEHRYHESLVHPAMSLGGDPKRVLILGGGDGLAVREVFKYPEVERIDLVDIDPQMTRLAREFGPLRKLNRDSLFDPRVRVHHVDAFNYVMDLSRVKHERDRNGEGASDYEYDRILIDLPDPHSEVLNKLYSREFYTMVSNILAQDGCLVTQSGSPIVTREAFWCVCRTLEASRLRVTPYRTFLNSFGEWGFHLAVKESASTDAGMAALRDVPLRYLNNDILRSSQVFARDDGPVETPINSLFEPKLYMLYEMGLSR